MGEEIKNTEDPILRVEKALRGHPAKVDVWRQESALFGSGCERQDHDMMRGSKPWL